jgi:hypothetical protein
MSVFGSGGGGGTQVERAMANYCSTNVDLESWGNNILESQGSMKVHICRAKFGRACLSSGISWMFGLPAT